MLLDVTTYRWQSLHMRRVPRSERLYSLVGDKLLERRKALGLSQEQVARKSGYTRATVANIEAGNQRPTLHTLIALANRLDVDYRHLLPSPRELEEAGQHVTRDLPDEWRDIIDAASLGGSSKTTAFLQEATSGET